MTRFGEGLDLEIKPEPTASEREAILCALAAAGMLAEGATTSAWWAGGLRETLTGDSVVAHNHD